MNFRLCEQVERVGMLYKIDKERGAFDRLEPMPFKDFSNFGQYEKDLENLIATSLLGVLFEESRYMPIFQERQWQSEADIYALNEFGDLIIFELKRGRAGEDAVLQALKYAQVAGKWRYAELEKKFQKYSSNELDLVAAHQEAFSLPIPLSHSDFNLKQHSIVIGSAADDKLVAAVDYWTKQGISMDFLPYRIYEIEERHYFEFFAVPYDQHKNPSEIKGVIFDTNRSWNEESIWEMMENKRVAAYGDAKRFIQYLNPNDVVFFSHKWTGIVAAARVKSGRVQAPNEDTLYREVEFLTPVPHRSDLAMKAMPFGMVSEVTGKKFYWARTIKVPYLSREDADKLVHELNVYLG